MAEQIDKDTGEPIHFNEAYRRAKRNALFWAAATFAISWGRSDNGEIELPTIRELAFDHWLIVATALVILAFMTAGFYRASKDIERRNSNFQEESFDTSATAEQVVTTKVNDQLTVLAKAADRLTMARVNAERASDDIGGMIRRLPLSVTDVDAKVDTIFESALVGHRDRGAVPIGEFQTARDRARQTLIEWAEECKASLRQSREDAAAIIVPLDTEGESLLNEGTEQIATTLRELKADLENTRVGWRELQNFSDHLDQSKLAWHRWYDTGLTWTAVGVAGAVASWFLAGTVFTRLLTPGEWLLRLTT